MLKTPLFNSTQSRLRFWFDAEQNCTYLNWHKAPEISLKWFILLAQKLLSFITYICRCVNRVASFFLVNEKPDKTYQMNTKCTKWSQNIPNVYEIFQMAIKYNILQSKALQNLHKLGFLVWKLTIWQPKFIFSLFKKSTWVLPSAMPS
jgi:hypothetical protein